MTNRFVGKTVAEYLKHDDCVSIKFTDSSILKIRLSFDYCYYESDRPCLEVEEKLAQQTLAEAIGEVKRWFEHNPNRKVHTFWMEWGDRVVLYRDKVDEELTAIYGERVSQEWSES